MKICVATHIVDKGHGQGRVNYEIVRAAIQRGHEVTLLSSQIAPTLKHNSQINWIPIHVAKWPTELAKNMAFSVQSARWLQRNRSRYDIVKINGAITSVAADVNAVHFVHSSWLKSPEHTFQVRRDPYGAYQWLYTALNAYWEKRAFKRAGVVVAVSQKIAEELIAIGVPAECIQVIINGVNVQEFAPGTVERRQFNLPEAVPVVLFAGDIQTSRKNLDTVLQALVSVPSLHLAIAGSTEGSPYPQLASHLNLSQRTHFLGYCRNISALMKAVDFFVFPSRYEPWGLALVEAMASGLPVVTTATVGAAELISPECGIVLSDPNNAQDLAQSLNKLSAHTDLTQSMGRAARMIAEKHSWEKMAAQYLDLFEREALQSKFYKVASGTSR